jgi:hypothetical protein
VLAVWLLLGAVACAAWSVAMGRTFRRERALHERYTRAHNLWMAREYRRLAALTGVEWYSELARACEERAARGESATALNAAGMSPLAERSSKAAESADPSLKSRIAERQSQNGNADADED